MKTLVYNACSNSRSYRHRLIICLLTFVWLSGCVSNKKLTALQDQYERKIREVNSLEIANKDLRQQNTLLENKLTYTHQQMDFMKEGNTLFLRRLLKLAMLSGTRADSAFQSLENLGEREAYIQTLQASLAYNDSLMMDLVSKLKEALADVNNQAIDIKLETGMVYISISDKILFKNSSYQVDQGAKTVLGKVAQVLASRPDMEFVVEGHSDSAVFSNACIIDTWDLSVKRATAVTRILQEEYQIDPKRITAAGRGEYLPVAPTDTKEGRVANRRTCIIIQPQLDQLFQLLANKQ